ncbi:hypothetical protein RA307_31370 [Xanthobacteraceae bacterium Astr-EGSB]|uniref:head-tail joining protein n=1 Tax=Astrobacterium formosum TaxID=3069710 RepID=UPI0027AF1B2E|nr:hypothetical protein [Xanthobacteraceae bacterium Astr-EGSB]
MSDLFDGLADIFTETLGEPVVYTPASTGVDGTITAIWIETPISAEFSEADSDDMSEILHVRASDVPAPAEGDTARRVKTGVIRQVVPPIRGDGKGMIALTLARSTNAPGVDFSDAGNSGYVALFEDV